jgi:hypothetical protein
MSDPTQGKRLAVLSALVQFEQEVRAAESIRALSYIAVNDSRRAIDFRQAFIWREDDFQRIHIHAASNIADIDLTSPAIQALLKIAHEVRDRGEQEKPQVLSLNQFEPASAAAASGFLAPNIVTVPMHSRTGAMVGGLVFARERSWTEGEVTLLGILAGSLSHAWNALVGVTAANRVRVHLAGTWKRYLAAILLLFLLPVRQYVIAPAEVIPLQPFVITAPLDGVIDQVEVEPNDMVQAGQLLFRMDDTDLSNQHILAQRSLDVAEAEYLRNAQEAFRCEPCRGRLPELRALRDREKAALDWARERLEKSNVRAPMAGILTFPDVFELKGRPVSTGQRIMTLSNPDQTQLRINLPVDDAIVLKPGAEVMFYPGTDPLSRARARLVSAGYEVRQAADQSLAFPLLATFDVQPHPRLGLRGSAKVYGDRAPVAYLVLRKPLAWLRRTLGV